MDDAFKYWALCIVNFVIGILEFFSGLLFGWTYTKGTWEERLLASKSYEHSAQLVTIKARAKYSIFMTTKLEHFIYKHERYVHPNYVLERKNATLLVVMKEYALFSVTDPDINIFNTEQFPFNFIANYFMAKQSVILPINSFHRLANELGDPKVPVVLNNMTARCGSTLLIQMINRVPNTRAISEATATCSIHELHGNGLITEDENKALLRSALRLHCKISEDEKVDRIFMKMNPLNAPQFHIFKELFPQFNLIFNTRKPIPSLKSWKQVFKLVTNNLYTKLGMSWRYSIDMKFIFPYNGRYDWMLKRYNKWWKNVTNDEVAVNLYTFVLYTYFNHKEIYDHVVLYENLSENPEKEMKAIYKILDIPERYLPLSLNALEKDSQRGTFGKQGEARTYALDQEVTDNIDWYCKELELPVRVDMSDEEFKREFKR